MTTRFSMKIALVLLSVLAGIAAPLSGQGGKPADRDGVRSAVLDYVEGFYLGDTTRFVRSVAPNVYKYGYSMRGDAYVGSQMQYAGFMSFANGVKAGRNLPPANAPKDIVLFDVQDQTASAKLTAWWGTDYLLLAKQDGRWVITHVMWQSPPPAR
jgi:hypothetical protein